MRQLYSLAIYLLTPVILIHLLWRGLRNSDYLKRWSERFGLFDPPAATGGIVIHAVSVGEVNAASPLVRGLRDRFPDLPLSITTFTPTGSERVSHLFADQVFHVYAPIDTPGAVRRFYQRLQPSMLIIMETEIWPNLFYGAESRQIPVVIANARVSEKSVRGYRLWQPLAQHVLQSVSGIAAQTETDASRLVQCGARDDEIEVVGSLKFDVRIPNSLAEEGENIRLRWGPGRPVLIAASTHEGDEQPLLTAFAGILDRFPDALLVLVPRHPERFTRSAQLARQQGFRTQLRSETEVCDPGCQCFVIDSMGELLRYCAAADVAFVGGSFDPIGGHNVLEPAALAKPVLFGPHVFNFQEITDRLLSRGGAIQVDSAAQLAAQVIRLFEQPELKDRMGQAGLQLVKGGQGALESTLVMIKALLETKPDRTQ